MIILRMSLICAILTVAKKITKIKIVVGKSLVGILVLQKQGVDLAACGDGPQTSFAGSETDDVNHVEQRAFAAEDTNGNVLGTNS